MWWWMCHRHDLQRSSNVEIGVTLFAHWLVKGYLRWTGFTVVGHEHLGQHKRYVVIAAPHTSNWDLAHTLCAAHELNIPIRWVGKHTLFRWPLGWLMRKVGGIPVDRRSAHGMVEQLAKLLQEHEALALLVPPEGTRSKAKLWKSGFYHIAKTAHVPIACAFVDYAKKRSGLGPFIMPTADVRADMDKVRAFYGDIRGRFPELETVPRLKEEL